MIYRNPALKASATATERRWWLPLLFVLAFAVPVSAQIEIDRPRVGVVPFANATEQAQNDAVAQTTSDTILLTLRLVGNYEVIAIDPAAADSSVLLAADPDQLETTAAALEVDNLMFGAVTRDDDGAFQFEIQVYDRGQGEVTVDAISRAESLFDVFDAADELVLDAVGGFSGIRIGFGSLSVQPANDGEFRLYVDGSLIGDNVRSLDRVLIGERAVTITQLRGGREVPLVEETITFAEGERRTIAFEFPIITDEEIAREAELNQLIERNLRFAINVPRVASAIDELAELYARLPGEFQPGAERLPWYRARLEIAQDIELLAEFDYIEVAQRGGREATDPVNAIITPWTELFNGFAERVESDWQEAELERMRTDIRRNATINSELIDLMRVGYAEVGSLPSSPDTPPTGPLRQLTVMDNAFRLGARLDGRRLTRIYRNREAERGSVTAINEFERADERRRPFRHVLGWITGAAAVGASAYIQFADVLPAARADVDNAVSAYNSATSVEAAAAARRDVNSTLAQLNVLEGVAVGGYAIGGTLLTLSTLGRLRTVGRPERIWNRYLDTPHLQARRAAALDVRERRWMEGETAVLVIGDERTFDVGARSVRAQQTPFYFEANPGEQLEIEILGVGDPEAGRRRFTVQPGLNIVMLEDLQ